MTSALTFKCCRFVEELKLVSRPVCFQSQLGTWLISHDRVLLRMYEKVQIILLLQKQDMLLNVEVIFQSFTSHQ